MTVEDGTGIETADSYVDPASAFAVSYMDAHLYADDWNSASAPKRENACIMASRTLDANYDWNGRPLTDHQGLAWPRTGFYVDSRPVAPMPKQLLQATLETALALIQKNRISDTAAGAAAVKKINLGDSAMEIEFAADPVVNSPPPPNQMIPPYVRKLLYPFGSIAGGYMVRVERR